MSHQINVLHSMRIFILKGLFIFLFGFSYNTANAQHYDFGVMIGASNYMGELSNQELNGNHYHFALGATGRYNYSKRFSFSTHFYYGKISGNDADHSSEYWSSRNLDFRSNIFEIGFQNEFDLMALDFANDKYFTPYLFVGISGYYFNPKTVLNGEIVDLQPLGTEGQEVIYSYMEKYNKFGVAFPFGGGLKYLVNENLNFGFELGMRKTFNDYIDDVSTLYPDIESLSYSNPMAGKLSYRSPELLASAKGNNPVGQDRGNPDNKDWLFFGGVTITVNLKNK